MRTTIPLDKHLKIKVKSQVLVPVSCNDASIPLGGLSVVTSTEYFVPGTI